VAIERINPELCIGCGKCVKCCPADSIRIDKESGKAFAKYPEDCATCCLCMLECPKDAITMSFVKTSSYFTSWG